MILPKDFKIKFSFINKTPSVSHTQLCSSTSTAFPGTTEEIFLRVPNRRGCLNYSYVCYGERERERDFYVCMHSGSIMVHDVLSRLLISTTYSLTTSRDWRVGFFIIIFIVLSAIPEFLVYLNVKVKMLNVKEKFFWVL